MFKGAQLTPPIPPANHGNTDCTLSLCNNINADVAAPISALIDTPTKTILEGGAPFFHDKA